jgi:hypothetical protein
LLPQKKKRVRNSSKRKRHVSGSMDTTGRDWRLVFFKR